MSTKKNQISLIITWSSLKMIILVTTIAEDKKKTCEYFDNVSNTLHFLHSKRNVILTPINQ
jgi:uncharacterized protein YoxC